MHFLKFFFAEAYSFDDLSQFIEKVKSSPILYQHKYSGASYGKQKIEQWIEIAKTFGVPGIFPQIIFSVLLFFSVKECLARWRTLREKYSRERRLQNTGGAGKKWDLFDNLSFLDQHVKRRRLHLRFINQISYFVISGDSHG